MIVASAAVAITIVIQGMGWSDGLERIQLIKPEDVYLPKEIFEEDFGLFLYDAQGNKIRTTQENAPFDINKPVIIFAYDMNYGCEVNSSGLSEYYNSWQQKGYNVALFQWNQDISDDLAITQRKIWASNPRRKKGGKTVYEYADAPNYSLAQIFVAYYYDFMINAGFRGKEIRFGGSSLGAQLITASCDYLLTLEQNDKISKEFLPDRVTLFDAFFTNDASNVYIDWRNKTIGEHGSISLASDTIKLLHSAGIAVEYVRSSCIDEVVIPEEGGTDYFAQIIKDTCFLDYHSGWLEEESISDIMQGTSNKHCLGQKWYNLMLEYPLPNDNSASNFNQYGVSPNVPTSYTLARMGTVYQMYENNTLAPSDDKQYSTNAKVPFVAGIAFDDKNANGNYDERLFNRINGIKVELYLIEESSERLIGATHTKNGYYEIPIEPIYIFNTEGKEFYIKVEMPSGYKPSLLGENEEYYLMTNDIKQDNKSQSFFIYSRNELKIKNIGLIRN